jgi:iron complex transport system substrate-binding protein
MRAVAWANGAAFALALATSTAVAWTPLFRSFRGSVTVAATGAPPVRDHSGVSVPARSYRRIVSGSALADALLLELCEPDRIVAFTAHGRENSDRGYRFAGKPGVRLDDVEAILALRPDLVFVNAIGDPRRIARLRDAGLNVFDLGEMRGLETLIVNMREIGALTGNPDRGERLARTVRERMDGIAADIRARERRRGIYLSIYGGRLFGGASGTSFDDILRGAGLVDAAAARRDWPEYTTEDVLALDPDVVVTNRGMGQAICDHGGMRRLRACAPGGMIVEVDPDILGDPGLGMVDAAQAVRDRVYGPPPALAP